MSDDLRQVVARAVTHQTLDLEVSFADHPLPMSLRSRVLVQALFPNLFQLLAGLFWGSFHPHTDLVDREPTDKTFLSLRAQDVAVDDRLLANLCQIRVLHSDRPSSR